MNKNLCCVICLLLCFVVGNAQGCLPDKEFWADFKGTAGDNEIQLSVYRSADDILSGNYRFLKNETTVFLFTGYEKNCTYYLDVVNDKNEAYGKFTFQYNKAEDKCAGNFTGIDKKQTPVQLQLGSMVGGFATQRYYELFGTTNEVDSFAAIVKRAFLKNDKSWLAAHCSYPLEVYMGSHKPVIVKDKQAFLANYNKYFSQAYKDKFKKNKVLQYV